MNKKICFFNRSTIHYRKSIWLLMDKELPCDFFFGDTRPGKIKPISYELFEHFKGEFHNITIGPFYWQKGVLSLLKSDYTDIITTAEPFCISSWLLILLAKKYHKNVYTWTHGAYGNEGYFKRMISKWKINHLKGCFLYGEYAKNIIVKWGVPESKLHVIYNSLSYDEHLALRKSISPSNLFVEHFNNRNPNIVFIGRLTLEKKLNQILEAMLILREEGLHLNVTFIGDGDERERIEMLSNEYKIQNNVWLYGACYDEKKIADFLYNADICVSPGNVGLTAMHAMSLGCPVISHNNYTEQMPEVEAILEGKTGALFKQNDINSLAETIKSWFSTCGDRQIIRHNCYRVIDEKYNPHIQLNTLKTIILNN